MGSYLPDLLSSGMQLVIALFLGMGFGFVLEQAGFSDSRRLAGLFYGKDFVVLRVFFTAAVTAMIGISLLAFLGLINLDMIYVNPLFVRSAIVGGVVMGAGFIVGGFCPGTSVCAAAIGRIDAIFFALGVVGGVLVYAELYPLLTDFMAADAKGALLVNEALGMSRAVFILLVGIAAMLAFLVTSMIEDKVNARPAVKLRLTGRPASYVAVSLIVLISMFFLPDKKTQALATITSTDSSDLLDSVPSEDLDYVLTRLLAADSELIVIDVRPTEQFDTGHLPTAVNIPLPEMVDPGWRSLLRQVGKDYLIYSQDETLARKAAVLADQLGDSPRISVLSGGYLEYHQRLYEPAEETAAFARFRKHAVPDLERIAEEASAVTVKPEPKLKIQGGC